MNAHEMYIQYKPLRMKFEQKFMTIFQDFTKEKYLPYVDEMFFRAYQIWIENPQFAFVTYFYNQFKNQVDQIKRTIERTKSEFNDCQEEFDQATSNPWELVDFKLSVANIKDKEVRKVFEVVLNHQIKNKLQLAKACGWRRTKTFRVVERAKHYYQEMRGF